MRLITLALIAITLALASAEASRYIEPLLVPITGEGYQFDGGRERDASDLCRAPSPPLALDSSTSGTLVPMDDVEDNYGLFVPAWAPREVTVTIQPSPLLAEIVNGMGSPFYGPGPNYDLEVWGPGCLGLLGSSRSPGAAADSVTFLADRSGEFVVRVVAGAIHVGTRPYLPLTVTPEAPRECHSFCITTFNALLGYSMTSSS